MSGLQDPRVLFAAERTLLAWHRTSLALIAFGFVIERSGLLMQVLAGRDASHEGIFTFWGGLLFIVFGAFTAMVAVSQYRTVLRSLRPAEIPLGYRVNLGVFANLVLAALGIAWAIYLLLRGPGL